MYATMFGNMNITTFQEDYHRANLNSSS